MLVPKLVTTLKTYTRQQFYADAIAGVIVGVVALPLAIAFAIASGVTPDRGLYTAVIAGFLISALGGSRVQIGGPTGAFVVIVYGIVQQHGVDGLLAATLMAGVPPDRPRAREAGRRHQVHPVSRRHGLHRGDRRPHRDSAAPRRLRTSDEQSARGPGRAPRGVCRTRRDAQPTGRRARRSDAAGSPSVAPPEPPDTGAARRAARGNRRRAAAAPRGRDHRQPLRGHSRHAADAGAAVGLVRASCGSWSDRPSPSRRSAPSSRCSRRWSRTA